MKPVATCLDSADLSLEALRRAGAPDFDPVAWHYIATLADKARHQNSTAQALLHSKLDTALRRLHERMCAANAVQPSAHAVQPCSSPLAQWLQAWPRSSAAVSSDAASPWNGESTRMLQFRKTLSMLSMHKQVQHAIAQAPPNAGPINSQMLVLRSLSLMRQHSPDYLNRFLAYVDTLLCLEQASQAKPVTAKTASKAKPRSAAPKAT